MIEIVKGNLFEHLETSDKHVYIAHVVNDRNRWGAGFTAEINKYCGLRPQRNYENFIASFDDESDALGYYHKCIMDGYTVVHLCAMHGVYNKYVNPHPLVYDALESALESFYISILCEDRVVYMPKIGAGLARGNWSTIYGLIQYYHTVPTRIFEL